MFKKVTDQKQAHHPLKANMNTFFDIQPSKQLVKPKKEVLDLIECMDTVKHVKEEHSHYQNSTFSKYKGSLRMHHPAYNLN